jgi:hypothetical protein
MVVSHIASTKRRGWRQSGVGHILENYGAQNAVEERGLRRASFLFSITHRADAFGTGLR